MIFGRLFSCIYANKDAFVRANVRVVVVDDRSEMVVGWLPYKHRKMPAVVKGDSHFRHGPRAGTCLELCSSPPRPMERAGWSESRIKKIMGENWVRVFGEVWNV